MTSTERPMAATQVMTATLRVLIVEDSADDAELILLALKEGGYDVLSEVVATETTYARTLAKAQWDVILCDHNLPRFDSFKALKLLQSQGRDIPFIIVSGAIGEEVAVAAMKAGASDYVMKDRLARLVPAIEREIREAGVRRERAQAQEALRESEERYRTLFESMDEGFCIVEVVFDGQGEPVDFRFMETNPAFKEHTGIPDAVGKTARELAPQIDESWLKIHGDIVSTGRPVRLEKYGAAVDRWFEVFGFRLGLAESCRVAILFNNITDRVQAQQQIAASLREKEVLLREVHHRVKNNLHVVSSLLSLQAAVTEDSVAARALLESQSRVRAMGLVHDQLHLAEDVALVDFGEYLRKFVPSLIQLFCRNGKAVDVEIDADDANLSVDIASPMALIVNELVTNALKYAFPEEGEGRLRIEARTPRQKGEPVLIVQDSGAGIPSHVLEARSSFGLELVETLAKQVGCRLQIDTSRGTTVSLVQESMP